MDKFEVLRLIGEGGYGVVYKCRHRETSDIVAIKKIKHSINGDPRKVGIREIRILTALKHPNINQFLGAFKSKDKLYLVLECIEKTLLDVLNDNPHGLASQKCRSFTYQLASAIQWCHTKGIVHRDVKPENLLITDKEVLKLCDFGFARFLPISRNASIASEEDGEASGQSEFHQLTVYVATRWYRPPELILRLPYGKPVDVWPIGCIIVEMATGEPLFSGDTDIDQLFQITSATGPFTSDQMEAMLASPKFHFLTNTPQNGKGPLAKKYSLQRFEGLLGDEMFDILKRCIKNDPNQRITAEQCAAHPGFELERRLVVPQQNTLGKLSQLLTPHSTNRNRRLDWVKYITDSSDNNLATPAISSARSSHMSKEEEMLMDAEVDLEKEREIEEVKMLLARNARENTSFKMLSSLINRPSDSSSPNNSQKNTPLPPDLSSAFPQITRNTQSSAAVAGPYSLQRSYTWYKSTSHSQLLANEDRQSSFITKLLSQVGSSSNNNKTTPHSSSNRISSNAPSMELDLNAKKPRQRTVAINLSRATTQPQFFIAKTSEPPTWDIVPNKQESKGFSNTTLQSLTLFSSKLRRESRNDLQLPEHK